MESISFVHPDTFKEHLIKLNSEITIIYGGNGAGKTTLSRKFRENNCAVFNADFITENVFIIETDGAKTNSKTKENLTKIFVGKDAIELAKKVIECKKIEKAINEEKEKYQVKIDNLLASNRIVNQVSLDQVVKSIEYDFEYNVEKNESQNKQSITLHKSLETELQTEIDFDLSKLRFQSNRIIEDLRNKIENNILVKNILNMENYSFASDFSSYNNYLETLINIEMIFDKHGKSHDVKDWIKKGLTLHENKDYCIFCSNENIEESLKNWREKLSNNLLNEKANLTTKVINYEKSIENITNQKELFKDVAPKIIETLENIQVYLKKVTTNLKENRPVEIEIFKITKDDIYQSEERLSSNITNYLLNKHLTDIIYYFESSQQIKKQVSKLEDDANKANKKYAKEIEDKVNKYSKILGFGKQINIKTDNRSIEPKIDLDVDKKTGKISNYSDGQRHKLALAIFFAMLEHPDNNYSCIVLDDPVISLDIFGYHSLKTLLMLKEINPNDSKLIILTHNIHYLLIQVSNLLTSEKVNVYELTPSEVLSIPLDLLTFDDITLFKKSLLTITDLNDLSLKYWMSNKIFRIFLDLRLRILGVSMYDNPKDGIKLLHFDEATKKEIQCLSNKITKCSKSIITVNEVINLFRHLNHALKLLEFPSIIDEESIDQIKLLNENEKVMSNPTPQNLMQDILSFARSIHFSSTDSKLDNHLKNYLNHPKHQFTENLIALRANKDH